MCPSVSISDANLEVSNSSPKSDVLKLRPSPSPQEDQVETLPPLVSAGDFLTPDRLEYLGSLRVHDGKPNEIKKGIPLQMIPGIEGPKTSNLPLGTCNRTNHPSKSSNTIMCKSQLRSQTIEKKMESSKKMHSSIDCPKQ